MTQRRHRKAVALISGLALVATGCGGDDESDTTSDDAAEATTSAVTEDEADDGADDSDDESSDDGAEDSSSAGSGATVPEGADALAIVDIDGLGSYEIALSNPDIGCFVSEDLVTITGDGPNGEDASFDSASLADGDIAVYLDVPDDGVQVGAGTAAPTGEGTVEATVSGDRVTGSAVFVAYDGSGEYDGTFEFVCGQ